VAFLRALGTPEAKKAYAKVGFEVKEKTRPAPINSGTANIWVNRSSVLIRTFLPVFVVQVEGAAQKRHRIKTMEVGMRDLIFEAGKL
jgi:hypothetical protein